MRCHIPVQEPRPNSHSLDLIFLISNSKGGVGKVARQKPSTPNGWPVGAHTTNVCTHGLNTGSANKRYIPSCWFEALRTSNMQSPDIASALIKVLDHFINAVDNRLKQAFTCQCPLARVVPFCLAPERIRVGLEAQRDVLGFDLEGNGVLGGLTQVRPGGEQLLLAFGEGRLGDRRVLL